VPKLKPTCQRKTKNSLSPWSQSSMTKGANRPIGPWPIRSLELSLPGLFAPWPSCSLANSPPDPFARRLFRSRERKFYGTFVRSLNVSIAVYFIAVLHLHSRPLLSAKTKITKSKKSNVKGMNTLIKYQITSKTLRNAQVCSKKYRIFV